VTATVSRPADPFEAIAPVRPLRCRHLKMRSVATGGPSWIVSLSTRPWCRLSAIPAPPDPRGRPCGVWRQGYWAGAATTTYSRRNGAARHPVKGPIVRH
jgi:hypothetical protein